MDILKHKDSVIALLKSHPHLRDDDNKLVANIWHKHLKDAGMLSKDITAEKFLELFSENKIPNAQSIRRIRRKLQEEFKELRGEKWRERHNEQEKVKDQLYNTPNILAGGAP